ncbi:hypothetical protein EJ04DRAFT_574274 [Polyplosphaeria fusca]|uniref:Fucose-specific lectin n=1 Tax=Polyplosphaeria fusca TaxID=682080 RepID=A0A9P4R449_9PLEO|nr:hypothetical protein EJ04DRAFT_574274 [Polyplosphaeria fusca]
MLRPGELAHIKEEAEVIPKHEIITALPSWQSAYNPNRPIHTRHGSQDPVLEKDVFFKEKIGGTPKRSRSRSSSLDGEENTHHSRMLFWLIICLVVLLILAIVLGAVLGTLLPGGSNAPPDPSVTEIPAGQTPTTTPTPTSGDGRSSPTPTPSMHIASLSVTGWSIEGPEGYFAVWLFWQNSRGYLSRATFNSSTGNWTRVSNFVKAKSGTPLAAAAFTTEYYKDQPNFNFTGAHHQAQVVYLDEKNRVNEWVFTDTGPALGEAGSLNDQKYMAHGDTQLASYWPNIIYQGMSGEMREARFACYERETCWNDGVLATTQPVNGSHMAMIPFHDELASVGVFYQEEDGRYLNFVEDSDRATAAFSDRISLNSSLAAFATTRKSAPSQSSLDKYLLWQSDDDKHIYMAYSDDSSDWKGPVTHPALAGAEAGTALSCLTGMTFTNFSLLEGTELSRCYFQTGAAVREVSFDGTSWDIVSIVPIEL